MTKRILGLLSAIAAFLLASGFQQPAMRPPAQSWTQFQSKEGGFSILMPGQPTRKVVHIETAAGTMDSIMFKADIDSASYQVAYFDIMFAPSGDDLINKLLDGARDGGLGETKSQLVGETQITLDGFLGREIKAKSPKGFIISRLYMVKDRLYGTIIEGLEKIDSPAAIKFLDSFKLVKIISPVEEAGWVEFSSVEGGFSVWMPGKPFEQPVPEDFQKTLEKAGISMRMFMYVMPKGDVFMAGYSDLEGGYSGPDWQKQFLDGVRNGMVSKSKGKLLSEKPIAAAGYHSREFIIEVPTGIIRNRTYVIGNRSYQLHCHTPLKVQDKTKTCDMFFDSFRLVNRQKT